MCRELAGVRGRVSGYEVKLLALLSSAVGLVDADCHRRPRVALYKVDALLCRRSVPSRRARASDEGEQDRNDHVLGSVYWLVGGRVVLSWAHVTVVHDPASFLEQQQVVGHAEDLVRGLVDRAQHCPARGSDATSRDPTFSR
eukprot:3003449-Rhodomonas_salina.2